jgi:isopropylmalate/homocitrate/citramalate synthase
MWFYPDNSRILELSLKCPPAEMFQVAVETTAYLQGRGVDISGDQQTKTKTALDFYAAQAAAEAAK